MHQNCNFLLGLIESEIKKTNLLNKWIEMRIQVYAWKYVQTATNRSKHKGRQVLYTFLKLTSSDSMLKRSNH